MVAEAFLALGPGAVGLRPSALGGSNSARLHIHAAAGSTEL